MPVALLPVAGIALNPAPHYRWTGSQASWAVYIKTFKYNKIYSFSPPDIQLLPATGASSAAMRTCWQDSVVGKRVHT
jgi:hypothetical protein